MVAVGQPPPGGNKAFQPDKGPDKKQPLGDKVKSADPTDAVVAAALANDPDVKVARAKVQLAEAELAKAKQAVVLKVMTLQASIREAKAHVEQCRDRAAWADRMVEKGVLDTAKAREERGKLESAQSALARLETELKLLTNSGTGEFKVSELPGGNASDVAKGLEWLMKSQAHDDQAAVIAALVAAGYQGYWEKAAVKGPIPDRIRAALDKPVKLGAKGEQIDLVKALEVFKKEAGLDVPVRGVGDLVKAPVITSQGEELPVGAWLQLFQDYSWAGGSARFYIRDYGLLFTDKTAAPPDAPTLTEFWKQKPPAAKKEPVPEPREGGR